MYICTHIRGNLIKIYSRDIKQQPFSTMIMTNLYSGHRSRDNDRMVVEFTNNYAISAYYC